MNVVILFRLPPDGYSHNSITHLPASICTYIATAHMNKRLLAPFVCSPHIIIHFALLSAWVADLEREGSMIQDKEEDQ
jgi:hypothetical protein